VELTTAARGRPVIRRPLGSDWLSFSHTRSDRLCVVGITRGPRIGVDVERVRGGLDVVSIARRAFGDAVAGRLDATPSDRRTDEFFRIWVHEEAKGKCRGIGLVEPDDAQPPPLFVADLALRDGYAAALASDAEPETVLGCTAEL
jgi:4'-phosphopantetheinyl transferase